MVIVLEVSQEEISALNNVADSNMPHMLIVLEVSQEEIADLRTALHLVAAAGHGMCVKALLDAGSDPDGRDAKGETPAHLAEQGKHMGCLRMMRIYQERAAASMLNGEKAHRRPK